MTSIDMSTLPPPQIVEALDYETILAAMVADLQTRDPVFTALVESDPAYKILECCAYREVLIRQQVNDAAQACMLAYAIGADLDQLAANLQVVRLVITPANPDTVPPTPAVMETDAALRQRCQLSFQTLSVAGPTGAYIALARGVTGVLDASATSPTPGAVVVAVLSDTPPGTASGPLLAAVTAVLGSDDVRPLTDNLTVQSAVITDYSVTAVLTVYPGPDPSVVLAASQAALAAYIASVYKLGYDITLAGITAALFQPGVQNVAISSPSADVVIDDLHAGYCTAVAVTVSGTDV